MRSIDQLDLKNKKVLLRVDFNVPIDESGLVTDDTRISATIPTIKKILVGGGSVILMSHLGRPNGKVNLKYSLQPVLRSLEGALHCKVQFSSDCIGHNATEKSGNLKPGEVLLLENLRFHLEEEAGGVEFAKQLSKLGDIYINDAFGTAHRAHASTSVIAQYFKPENRCFGYLMGSEVMSLERVLVSGKRPITAIIGGAKVSSKIEVLEHLLKVVDRIIIGGGMAYTFIKAQGGQIGKSLIEDDKLETAKSLLIKAKEMNVEVLLPVDSVNSKDFSNQEPTSETGIDSIPLDEMGLDIGKATIERFCKVITSSQTILWNGPMGVFEFSNYKSGTLEIGRAVAESTAKGAFSLVGGGDSVAAVNQFGLASQVSYVSTGGGAMLEYLEGKILPGIAALES